MELLYAVLKTCLAKQLRGYLVT